MNERIFMIEDFEKGRAEYIARLESDLAHVRRERDEYKAIAEKSKITVYVSQVFSEQNASYLQAVIDCGGKRLSTRIPAVTVYSYKDDKMTMVREVISNFIRALVVDQVVAECQVEFIRVADNMNSLFVKGMIQ